MTRLVSASRIAASKWPVATFSRIVCHVGEPVALLAAVVRQAQWPRVAEGRPAEQPLVRALASRSPAGWAELKCAPSAPRA